MALASEPLATTLSSALPDRTRWSRRVRRTLRSTVVVLGSLFALLVVVMALFAGPLAPTPPDEQNFDLIESPPGRQALFGTDRFGRDVLSRVIYGARISLYVATVSIGVAMLVGGVFGLAAGYQGGGWDNAISRVMDVFFSIPGLLLWLVLWSIYQRDYPLTQSTILFIALLFMTVNLLVGLLYGYLAPRIRYAS